MAYCQYCGRETPETASYCPKCGKKIDFISDDIDNIPQYVGANCPFCQTPIKSGVPVVKCAKCDIVHHADCWRENGNCCTTFGCSGTSASRSEERNQVHPSVLTPISRTNFPDVQPPSPPSSSPKLIWSVVIAVGI